VISESTDGATRGWPCGWAWFDHDAGAYVALPTSDPTVLNPEDLESVLAEPVMEVAAGLAAHPRGRLIVGNPSL
jgi:hypothetical protein